MIVIESKTCKLITERLSSVQQNVTVYFKRISVGRSRIKVDVDTVLQSNQSEMRPLLLI